MGADSPAPTGGDVPIRPLQESDIPAIVALINAADAEDGADEGTSEAEFRGWVSEPTRPGRGFVAVSPARAVVGYGEVRRTIGAPGVWGWIIVHPQWRQQGLGRRLAGAVRAAACAEGAAWLDYAVDVRLREANRWVARLGFEPIHTYMRLRLRTAVPQPPAPFPSGFRVRPFHPSEDLELVRGILNVSFADHHNANLVSAEQIAQNLRQPWFDPAGVLLACCAPGGDVAGLCWCYVNRDENARRGEAIGWINELGVAPAHRRTGLGRALLIAGIDWLRSQGMDAVELWVDSANRPARTLYAAAGFAANKTIVDYRHTLEL